MKKLILVFIAISSIAFSSCSNSDDSNTDNHGAGKTSLQGTWLLENNTHLVKLTFEGNNFTINSGTAIVKGTYTLVNNQMTGQLMSTNYESLKPNTFTGNVSISNNRVTFTNFSGNWYAIFSSWYEKQ